MCSSPFAYTTRIRSDRNVNPRWETSLRSPNNYVFPNDDLVMTVAKWYQTYSAPEFREMYVQVPKHLQRKGKAGQNIYAFRVELYINVEQVHITSSSAALHEYSHMYVIVRSSNQRP